MKNRDRYPDNWEEIALKVKEKAEWTCQKCGLECFPPNYLKHTIKDKSLKAKLTLTVHHSDYDPSNNDPSNLIPLCSACHLYMHRGKRTNMSIGSVKIRFRSIT